LIDRMCRGATRFPLRWFLYFFGEPVISTDKTRRFAAQLRDGRATLMPGAYDAFSARLIARSGFEGVYIGSYATAASAYGLPDVGLLSLTELVEHARRVAAATELPVLADGEAGFFEAVNIWRTVQAFEAAGVVGIHIEDNLGGKHTDASAGLLSPAAMALKIRAAVDAKTDPAFTIIARSDAQWIHHDLEDCVSRLQRYVDAGADAVFAPGLSARQLHGVRNRIKVPVMVLGDLPDAHDDAAPSSTLADYADAGADLIVLFYLTLGAAAKGVGDLLADLRAHHSVQSASRFALGAVEFEAGMDYAGYEARAKALKGKGRG
jgi:methylisocitrate lyase